MEKKIYTIPEFKVVVFARNDMITTSGDGYQDDSFGIDVPSF